MRRTISTEHTVHHCRYHLGGLLGTLDHGCPALQLFGCAVEFVVEHQKVFLLPDGCELALILLQGRIKGGQFLGIAGLWLAFVLFGDLLRL